jgi:hypothetical protein
MVAVFCAGERFYLATQFIKRDSNPTTKLASGTPLPIGSRVVTVTEDDVARFHLQQWAFNGAVIVGLGCSIVLISRRILNRRKKI